jgi:phage repressor protein C with HTH and peptisase S24 domain
MQENEQEISLIKRNIMQYLDSVGITPYKFYKASGVARGTLSNFSGMSEDNIAKFLAYAPDVNPEWLLTGKGKMTKGDSTAYRITEARDNISSEKQAVYNSYVPLVKSEAVAGMGGASFAIGEEDIQENYRVPDFQNIQFMIRVQGSSMYPKYTAGDIVACRILHEPSFIQWNKVHLIASHEQGILIKRLKQGSQNDRYLCISDNKEYDPFEIPVEEITGIALVVGVIRVE